MSKHILDSTRTRRETARSEQYARIEAADRPSPQSKAVQQRSQSTNTEARARRFVRIERSKAG
ncbi:MAG: hypothetical protein AAFN59_10465 [Pseudomonadota bacterium]